MLSKDTLVVLHHSLTFTGLVSRPRLFQAEAAVSIEADRSLHTFLDTATEPQCVRSPANGED
jgi:hypothetical protein